MGSAVISKLNSELVLRTAYSQDFNTALKQAIPGHLRHWRADLRAWVLDASTTETVRTLVKAHFPDSYTDLVGTDDPS